MRFTKVCWESSAFALAMASMTIFGGAASAQTAPAAEPQAASAAQPSVQPAASSAATDAGANGEVIVTGNRRESRLRDVPISIAVVSGEKLASSGYTTASDLQYLVPAVNYNPQIGAGFLVRGFGSQGFDYNIEKAVAVVVDDVVQGLPRSIGFNTLADIERIEVLEGPQGTLFGKNASAGVIFVVTRKPQLGVFSASGSARYGTDNESQIESTVNLPVTANVAARITGTYQRRDGYLTNEFNGFKGGGYRDYSLRAKLLWEPSSDFNIYLLAEVQDHRDDGTNTIETIRSFPTPVPPVLPTSQTALDFAALSAPYGIVFGPHNREYVNNDPVQAFVRQKGVQGTLTYRLGGYTLTAISAYKTQSSGNQTDGDYSATDFNKYNVGTLSAHQLSQEVRINSPVGGFVDFVVGGYFFDQNVSAAENQGGTRNRVLPANTYVGTNGDTANYTARSNSLAAFGEANFHLTQKITAVFGGRFTHDRVGASYFSSVDPHFNFIGTPPPNVSDTAGKDDLSVKGTLQYKPTSNLMLYATYAQGYKAPAIGTTRGTLAKVRPETVNNYEVGFKTQLFDRLLSLNGSFFIEDFKDLQTSTIVFRPDGTFTVVLANAPGVRSKGVELDAAVHPARDFSLTGSLSYNPTKYTTFLTSCYPGQAVNPAPGPGCYATGGSKLFDASGLPSINAPKTTFNVGFDYSPQISAKLRLIANANYSHRSSAYTTAGDPNTIIPGYGLLNANLGVGALDGSIKVSLYARNLLNKFFLVRVRALQFAGPGSYQNTVALEAQRTVGIKLDYSF
ncbi:MAG TPA: TonB-dependent receptor [Sphingomonas sp.]|uniref:TonB-dependent receptor n=1 Tax=Sphingomonas sp. TaxID=28214 RepID=UPI002C0DA40E|nr:TonB-dependent receptor [Sphingomonas sp.]HMI19147.1 TonB-dependent receptor [Sphingomonas sp.]